MIAGFSLFLSRLELLRRRELAITSFFLVCSKARGTGELSFAVFASAVDSEEVLNFVQAPTASVENPQVYHFAFALACLSVAQGKLIFERALEESQENQDFFELAFIFIIHIELSVFTHSSTEFQEFYYELVFRLLKLFSFSCLFKVPLQFYFMPV